MLLFLCHYKIIIKKFLLLFCFLFNEYIFCLHNNDKKKSFSSSYFLNQFLPQSFLGRKIYNMLSQTMQSNIDNEYQVGLFLVDLQENKFQERPGKPKKNFAFLCEMGYHYVEKYKKAYIKKACMMSCTWLELSLLRLAYGLSNILNTIFLQ